MDAFNRTRAEADSGYKDSQFKCFGMGKLPDLNLNIYFINHIILKYFTEYPLGCEKYYGPHPLECLETIWDSVKCLVEGNKHPSKLTNQEHEILDNKNLRYPLI